MKTKSSADQRKGAAPVPAAGRRSARGFTLIELLVVIVIVAILSAAGVPALRGMGKANRYAAAQRQILDDLAYARLQAINQRTKIYMIFASTNIYQKIQQELGGDPRELRDLTNAHKGQFTRYALVASRTVGDQPGKNTVRYLTPWKTLPEGMMFAPYKFDRVTDKVRLEAKEYDRTFNYYDTFDSGLPFPNADSPRRRNFHVPAIVFGPDGKLQSPNNEPPKDEILAMVEGSVSAPAGAGDPKIVVEPPATPGLLPSNDTNGVFQFVRINWLTGRAKVEGQDFP